MRFTRSFLFCFLSSLASAQVPRDDVRNTDTPTTNTHYTLPEYRTVEEWTLRKAHLRAQILSAAGLDPMPEKTPLHPQIFGRIDREGYTIEKVLLETLPGYYLGGNLYRPAKAQGKVPGVLIPHGHWPYGRLENQPLNSTPTEGINLARQGYIAFAYDMVGYNDTNQTPHEFTGPNEELWAFTPVGLQLWNSIRALDFIAGLNGVDTDRLAITGASGGATQTMLLTAVDDRIAVSAPVNMVSAYMQGGAICENAPGLRVGTFNVEIAAMFAPKPMLLVSATGDWTKHVPQEEFPLMQKMYDLYGQRENVENFHQTAPHNYNQLAREAVYRFFAKHLLHDADATGYAEKNASIERLQDMLALEGRTPPAGALNCAQIFAEWRGIATRQFQQTTDLNALRTRLSLVLGTEWPNAFVTESGSDNQFALGRKGRGDRVAGYLFKGKKPAVLVVDSAGADTARRANAVTRLIREGHLVLVIDAFQTGAAAAPRDRSDAHFYTYNRSDDANRVQDILTALAYLQSVDKRPVELLGLNRAQVWCLFAAAVAPVTPHLQADVSSFHGTDQEFLENMLAPGIQRAGGLKAALRLTQAAPVAHP